MTTAELLDRLKAEHAEATRGFKEAFCRVEGQTTAQAEFARAHRLMDAINEIERVLESEDAKQGAEKL